MASFTSTAYRLARLSASGRNIRRTVQTGDPGYALRRARNIAVGRTLARGGVWRGIWGKW